MPLIIGLIAFFLVSIVGAGWFFTENNYRMQAHYAPKFEDVRRETYEHSRAFTEGTIRDLQNLQLEYARSPDAASKDTIRSVARHRLADIDIETLPASVRTFARDMESVR
jgi:hypothetical protein